MKIRRPSLPSMPALAEAPSKPKAPELPKRKATRSSSFAAPPSGAERRFSVQFVASIEGRLQRAGVDAATTDRLCQRFGKMDRAALDHDGRLVDALLGGSHPKESIQLYGAIVHPDTQGQAVDAVQARLLHAFGVLASKKAEVLDPGMRGVANLPAEAFRLLDSDPFIHTGMRAVANLPAETFRRLDSDPLIHTGMRGVLNLPAETLRRLDSDPLIHTGMRGVANLPKEMLGRAIEVGRTAARVLGGLGTRARAQLEKLLDQAGKSGAPSARADPVAEHAVVFAETAKRATRLLDPKQAPGAMRELEDTAAQIRGKAREDVLKMLAF